MKRQHIRKNSAKREKHTEPIEWKKKGKQTTTSKQNIETNGRLKKRKKSKIKIERVRKANKKEIKLDALIVDASNSDEETP